MAIEWSAQQVRALGDIKEWLQAVRRGEADKVYRLFGYAGTGKSTLAKYIGDMDAKAQAAGRVRDVEDEDRYGPALSIEPQYCAFTGKAAVVMKRKGCANARTIHSLIYTTMDKSKETLFNLEKELAKATAAGDGRAVQELGVAIEQEKDNLNQPGFALKPEALTVKHWDEDEQTYVQDYRISMFIVDECSMVDARLGSDLLSFDVPVLVLGDPAQLPPVGSGGLFSNAEPHVLLTEIHRQADGNPIIDLANRVRRGEDLPRGQWGDSRVVYKTDLGPEEWLGADQILVGRNDTRRKMNGRLRQLKGYEGFLPNAGEKLVCHRNNAKDGLLNGGLWECVATEDDPTGETFKLHAKSLDEEREVHVQVHKANFMGQELKDRYDRFDANEFDFGYAMTVHKSQGSQWGNVILYDEWNMSGRQQWLYTGITRAAESVTVVQTK